MSLFILLVVVFFIAYVLSGVIRNYAIKNSLLDIPNERSSHQIATPRGGGIAIVIAFYLFVLMVSAQYSFSNNDFWKFMIPGLFIAIVGFWDDHGHIQPVWRLLAHFSCAILFLILLPSLPYASLEINFIYSIIFLFGAFYLVWMLNLYNFMDGIDGIAGVEAVTVCIGGGFLWWIVKGVDDFYFPLSIAIASLGFLLWNFPKAKLFMGDGGSGFLGFIIGCFAIISSMKHENLFWAWNILLGVFIVDATVTLIRRAMRGDKIMEAHKSHAYQYASRRYGSHAMVSIGVGVINMFFLFPIAWLVATDYFSWFLGRVNSF